MTGIYKIQNKKNGKIYIGQSTNIERRKNEHFYNNSYNRTEIDKIIQLEGKDNFIFEVIEECSPTQLNAREIYWINFYDSFYNGYNNTKGGQYFNGGRPKVNIEIVKEIRKAYAKQENKKDIYKKYKDILTEDGFNHIWDGSRWKDIMPEVYTPENKQYQIDNSRFGKGEKHIFAYLSDEEVIKIRIRYMKETAKEIWQDYKDKYTLGSFKQILIGVKYSHLPIYKKQEGKWINVGEY